MNSTGLETRVKVWTPAVPCKIQDNIISSDYATAKVFVPSYERERRPCIEQLLTNEYQRIWWQEKQAWDKRFVKKPVVKKIPLRSVIKKKPAAAGNNTQLKKMEKGKIQNQEKTKQKSKVISKSVKIDTDSNKSD